MSYNNFIDKIFSIIGLRPEVPTNEFRNPIWGSEDDDNDNEMFSRPHFDSYNDSLNLEEEFRKMEKIIFGKIGSLFGDMGSLFSDDKFSSLGTMTDFPENNEDPDNFDSNRLRQHFLKPGYHKHSSGQYVEDQDFDGKISSSEIVDMLQKKRDDQVVSKTPFYGDVVPSTSFSRTIITTKVRKPDGTLESRRIVKKGNEIVEDTTTYTEPSNTPISYFWSSPFSFFQH